MSCEEALRAEELARWVREHQHYDGERGLWQLSALQITHACIDVAQLIRLGWRFDELHHAMILDRGF